MDPATRDRLLRTLGVALLALTVLMASLGPVAPAAAFASPRAGEEAEEEDGSLAPDPTDLITEVFNILYRESVKRPDRWELAQYAIQGMLSGLRDYYASYYTEEDMAALMSDVRGEFGGVGIVVQEDLSGYLRVAHTLAGCPAERAGMLAGDLIVAVDGVDIKGEGLAAGARIRGEPGTTVVLTVMRDGSDEPLEFELVRELIELTSVEHRMLTDRVGYIRIMTFDADTHEEFDEALCTLIRSGATAFVLDLRNNPGGQLDVCERIVERFIPERHPFLNIEWAWRKEMVRARMRPGYEDLKCVPYGPHGRFPFPVAVVVNSRTASASEILAASLREWGLARIFGERTYGKGTVQTIYHLSNGGGLKLTTANWKTGLGHAIEGEGVVPDEVVGAPASPQGTGPIIKLTDQWTFGLGSMGSDIVILQMRLNQLGYDAGPEDGVFGQATLRALKAFQAAVGLPQTGVTDAETVAALNAARSADHPAGHKEVSTGAGGDAPPPADVPEVTGDQVIDRAIQWLQGQTS